MSCPNCGYCPSCGRGVQTAPYMPWYVGIPSYWHGNGPAPVIGTTTGTAHKLAELAGYQFVGQNGKKEL